MKKYTFISTVLIALFSLIFVSCDNNDEDFVPEKQIVSIKWDNWKTQVKSGEDDEDQHIIIPKVAGAIIDQSGIPISDVNVELRLMPEDFLKDETSTNFEGTFEFDNVEIATYEVVIIQGGEIIGREVLEL